MKKIFNAEKLLIINLSVIFTFNSCTTFLDQKPFKNVVVPNKLSDLQVLMDARGMVNFTCPDLPETLSDNYYATTSSWMSTTEEGRLNYIWNKESYANNAWTNIYAYRIYYSNVVLDQLNEMDISEVDINEFNTIKGYAIFHRSFGFFALAQLYCRPYSEQAEIDLGIPLRTTAAIEVKSVRSTVKETYDKIISDLLLAIDLLPSQTTIPTRPSKSAAYGLLARCYLSMRDYQKAGKYAGLCIEMNPELMDYNKIPLSTSPFRRFNKETIFYSYAGTTMSILHSSRGKIDSTLYNSYSDHDLRKVLYFQKNTGVDAGTFRFQGCYDGDYNPNGVFDGITVDEMYLIRAECYARNGQKDEALKDINYLMINRWDNKITYTTIDADNSEEALSQVLTERRKELVYRNLRWSDLRRFNIEGANITLKRVIDGTTYTLPPNDLRWVMLIPDEVINRSSMPQNKR